jgi:hypothetical protein
VKVPEMMGLLSLLNKNSTVGYFPLALVINFQNDCVIKNKGIIAVEFTFEGKDIYMNETMTTSADG